MDVCRYKEGCEVWSRRVGQCRVPPAPAQPTGGLHMVQPCTTVHTALVSRLLCPALLHRHHILLASVYIHHQADTGPGWDVVMSPPGLAANL